MSRVHQALRRAEQEGRSAPIQRKPFEQDVTLESGRRPLEEIALAGDETATNKTSSRGQSVIPAVEEEPLKIPFHSKLVALFDPKSIPGEQYRALKSKIFQMKQEKGLSTLLITSAAMSDGKTLTASNLAFSMAQEIGLRILLVDCDLRRPTIGKSIGLSSSLGLSEYLLGSCDYSQVFLKTEIPNLRIILGGSIPESPAELLNSQRMRDFLERAKQDHDWVIIDSPPLAALADADILASMVDGVLLVIRALQTPADLLEKCIETLRGKNLLGVVLNCYEDEKTTKYSHYYHYSRGS
jgi:capsular exopolysaccharide synthesis family protein